MISFVILTYNEELNIGKCLGSLEGLSDDIHIVDSGSSDKTVEIAGQFRNVRVTNHKFESFSAQRGWALANLPFKYDWLFVIDADYEVTPGLADRLRQIFSDPSKIGYGGFYVKWAFCFMGKRMRFGSHTPRYKLLLFNRKHVFLDPAERVDTRFYVKGLPCGYIDSFLIENDLKDSDFITWFSKQMRYATGVAEEELQWKSQQMISKGSKGEFGTPTRRILYLKTMYYSLPLYIRPWFYFFHDYLLKLGFLEGKEGFILHLFRNICYRTMVDVVLDQKIKANECSS